MLRKFTLIAMTLAAFGFTGPANAQQDMGEQPETQWGVGGLAGIQNQFTEGADPNFTWGVQGDYVLNEQWMAGLKLSSASESASGTIGTTTVEISNTLTFLTGEFSYRFPGFPGSFAGVDLGLSWASSDVGVVSTTETALAIGPRLGYDFMMESGFSIGVDGNLLFTTFDESDPVLNVFGAIKYWF